MLGKVESAELHTYIIKFPTWTTVASILGWLSENITPSLEKKNTLCNRCGIDCGDCQVHWPENARTQLKIINLSDRQQEEI